MRRTQSWSVSDVCGDHVRGTEQAGQHRPHSLPAEEIIGGRARKTYQITTDDITALQRQAALLAEISKLGQAEHTVD